MSQDYIVTKASNLVPFNGDQYYIEKLNGMKYIIARNNLTESIYQISGLILYQTHNLRMTDEVLIDIADTMMSLRASSFSDGVDFARKQIRQAIGC